MIIYAKHSQMARKSVSKNSSSLKYNFNLRRLCTPSLIYFVLSLIGLVSMGIQNLNDQESLLCVGSHRCNVGSKTMIFVLNGIYILFWTFVLDLMCKAGYTELSWILILIPFLLFFFFFGVMIHQNL